LGQQTKTIVLLVFTAVASAAETPGKIRVGGGYSVPWAFLAPDGTPTGFYVEVMKEAARREGLAFEPVFRQDGPEKSLASGAIDLWTAAVPTQERRKFLYFTEPWWSQEHYLGVLASSSIRALQDVAGHSVVYAATPPFTADIREVLLGAKLRVVNDLRARFDAVCDGSADAALFYHETSLFAVTGSNEMAACRERGLRLIPVGRPVMEVAIAALPRNQALADRFRSRLRSMAEDQTLARLAAHPLTGNDSVVKLFQAEESSHFQKRLELSVAFLSVLLLLSAAAYFRLRQANRRTREALALAEDALRAKREFLATMSHEIRTPMTAVIGYMDMLMGTPLRHDQRRFAAEVSQAAQALLTLLTSILAFAKPGQPSRIDDEAFDPASVIDDCIAAVLLEAEAKGLALYPEILPAIPRRLCGDPVRLRQAILNLLVNAIKFTSSGEVRLLASYSESTLECCVSDTGIGIPQSHLASVFDPFTQLDSSDTRAHGGVGLGLAVVATIASQLGGSIHVDSQLGAGSRFTLRLPFPAVPGEPGWLGEGVSGTALVLADPDGPAAIFTRYLRHAGLSVHWFRSFGELDAWPPPTASRTLCFIDGATHGTQIPRWRNQLSCLILIGSFQYLRSVDDDCKLSFDDILPLPAGARAIREILYPAAGFIPQPVTIRRRVLVVDDNAVNRRVLQSLLEKLGCAVDTANDGSQAVDAALGQTYAAILMDCQMPVMNGYDATAEIRRRSPSQPPVPICGVSASIDTETRARCQASGMTEFMPKPVTLENLQDLLTRLSAEQIIADHLQPGGRS
jgi:signal transduction histidine kinase/ActR/RegA family two-component response regulator